jgi:aspartate carbamoyltransferase catalytic subunit
MEKLQHILESQQWDKEGIIQLFEMADQMEMIWASGGNDSLKSCHAINLFYQPSTRTRARFSWAEHLLGISVPFWSENAGQFSSAVKGESLQDTIKVHVQYPPDSRRLAIVLRHPDPDAAVNAAIFANGAHIINAGCGKSDGQHPTQALLDVYTISKKRPDLERPVIVMVGDLRNGRTVRSLSYLATKIFDGVSLIFVSPPSLRMEGDVKAYLDKHNVPWSEETDTQGLFKAAEVADIFYMTRFQLEDLVGEDRARFHDYQRAFQLNDLMLKRMKKDSLILHPLPRNQELPLEVDRDSRAAYFDPQIRKGLFISMALFRMLFE